VSREGIGGLGHLSVQFAGTWIPYCRHRRGARMEKLAKIWRHVYIEAAVDDAAAALQRMGGPRSVLATATSGGAMGHWYLSCGPAAS